MTTAADLQNAMSFTLLSDQLILFQRLMFETGVFVASFDVFGTKAPIFDRKAYI